VSSPPAIDAAVEQLARDGFVILPGAFAVVETAALAQDLERALTISERDGQAIRSRAGVVYAARNVLDLYPPARNVWRRSPLVELLTSVLGPEFGLVRALFFDKPPERSWSLPWHKDLTIAVHDNRLPSSHFAKPTSKAGVPHVEAPLELLERMLTLRIHLDEMTVENGPLRVIAGSHKSGRETSAAEHSEHSVLSAAGDVLAMRPLLSHSSSNSTAGTTRHRRILHLEFAGQKELADGYAWHEFISFV
jgi:hypothetical protein